LKRKRRDEELAKEKEELRESMEEMKRIGEDAINEFRKGQENIEREVAIIGRNIEALVQLMMGQTSRTTSDS
jgi:hypothetical protein